MKVFSLKRPSFFIVSCPARKSAVRGRTSIPAAGISTLSSLLEVNKRFAVNWATVKWATENWVTVYWATDS